MKKLYNLLIVCSFSIAMLLTYSNANARIEEGDYYCSVSKNCEGGGSVSCNGSEECSRGSGSVTCDGKKTSCN